MQRTVAAPMIGDRLDVDPKVVLEVALVPPQHLAPLRRFRVLITAVLLLLPSSAGGQRG